MKTVTLETATLADAVMRAARVAPTKGAAWDKAAGVLIEVYPQNGGTLRVSATDLDVTYYQRVPVVEVGDEPVKWRVPSALASGWLSNLPMSAGKQIVLTQTDDDNRLQMKAGRSRTKLRLLPAEFFPKITPFDPALLADVPHFARRVEQVEWCTRKEPGALAGVYFDGDELIACDGVRFVTMPLVCPVPSDDQGRPSPFSVPLGSLVNVMRNADDVKLRVTDRRLEIMPDPDIQLTASLYAEPYPDVRRLTAGIVLEHELTFSREQLLDALQRMLVLVKTERYPKVTCSFHKDTLEMKMVLPEVGETEDEIDVTDGPETPFQIFFNPTNLLGVVQNAARESLHLHFEPNAAKPVKFTDESGFTAWLMPMEVA